MSKSVFKRFFLSILYFLSLQLDTNANQCDDLLSFSMKIIHLKGTWNHPQTNKISQQQNSDDYLIQYEKIETLASMEFTNSSKENNLWENTHSYLETKKKLMSDLDSKFKVKNLRKEILKKGDLNYTKVYYLGDRSEPKMIVFYKKDKLVGIELQNDDPVFLTINDCLISKIDSESSGKKISLNTFKNENQKFTFISKISLTSDFCHESFNKDKDFSPRLKDNEYELALKRFDSKISLKNSNSFESVKEICKQWNHFLKPKNNTILVSPNKSSTETSSEQIK